MDKNTDDTNQLWVHLSGLAGGNIFAIYPKILEEIFLQEDQSREEDTHQDVESITLPSDMEWRLKVYFRLVEKQRQMDDLSDESPALDKLKSARRWSRSDSVADTWDFISNTEEKNQENELIDITRLRRQKKQKYVPSEEPPWGPRDLAKAARLLEKPPLTVDFEDDQEMRRVYSLIYDVFRYKTVLDEALSDVGFYTSYPEIDCRKPLAWLLLLDQQRRKWAKRNLVSIPKVAKNDYNEHKKKDLIESSKAHGCKSTKNKIRESSLEKRFPRNLKSKIKAVRELSSDAKEAIRLARETSSESKKSFTLSVELNNHDDTNEVCIDELKLPSVDTPRINEEIDDDKSQEKIKESYLGESFSSRTTEIESTRSSDSSTSENRIDMQQIMDEVAAEIGPLMKKCDEDLWSNKTKIAAAIAKIRIRNKALTLSDLLPVHLRDDRVSAGLNKDFIVGWINIFKSRSVSELIQRLSEMGFSYSSSQVLEFNQFCFDRICPKFLSLRPAIRTNFVRSTLVTDNIIILQEREFCLGAAALCKALKTKQLKGDVVQTHGTSPKAAAYLAAQLRDYCADSGLLLIFGTGERKSEYDTFLHTLGANNVRVFMEGASEAAEALWSGAVAALAAPPNSYSAVTDPIDLVCSRGGDLGMLEVLTDSEINLEGKDRVMKILEEQKKVLRLCMSKPQIQIVVYETHSALSAENSDMVKRAVAEANRAVREIHAQRRQRARDLMPKAPKCAKRGRVTSADLLDTTSFLTDEEYEGENEHEKRSIEIISTDEKFNENVTSSVENLDEIQDEEIHYDDQKTADIKSSADDLSKSVFDELPVAITPLDPDSEYADVKVPDCDIFEEEDPPPLDNIPLNERDGCFLALLQRKELIRMNAKYMISVAEARGLFGGNTPQQKKIQPTKSKLNLEKKLKHIKRRLSLSQVERIAAPTQAWTTRIGGCYCCQCVQCSNCIRHHAASDALPAPRARIWWKLAIKYAIKPSKKPLNLPRGRPILPLNIKDVEIDTGDWQKFSPKPIREMLK